jgi:dienelactone hydrolase
MLAQMRPGVKAALLLHSCIPTSEFAHQLAETIETAELFVYPGERHLFTDNSLPDCDESAATLLKQRVLSFLDTIE